MTLALATSTYALVSALHLSGPIALVIAGLLIGNQEFHKAFSGDISDNLLRFWELKDKTLNSALFLLIGMEAVLIGFDITSATAGAFAIVAMLISRSPAVLTVIEPLRRHAVFTLGNAPALIWGGLNGGISVALALSLTESGAKPLLFAATYGTVMFLTVKHGLPLQGVLKQALWARDVEGERLLPGH